MQGVEGIDGGTVPMELTRARSSGIHVYRSANFT